jgi:hypothetical protein
VALLADRIARLTLSPFVFAFLGAGLRAGAFAFFLRRRSLNSSSSGSPSLLSSESSSDGASVASTPLSLPSPRFRFVLPVGLVPGANLAGLLDTRPDLRRAAEDATWSVGGGDSVALMVLARDCSVDDFQGRGGMRGAIGVVEAGTVMGDALYVRALLVQGCAHVRLTLRNRRVANAPSHLHSLVAAASSVAGYSDARCIGTDAVLGSGDILVQATIYCIARSLFYRSVYIYSKGNMFEAIKSRTQTATLTGSPSLISNFSTPSTSSVPPLAAVWLLSTAGAAGTAASPAVVSAVPLPRLASSPPHR